MTTEERDALVMAPVGTPGLEELGLVDPDYADAQRPGPAAVDAARQRWSELHRVMAADAAMEMASHLAGMTQDDKLAFLRALAQGMEASGAG